MPKKELSLLGENTLQIGTITKGGPPKNRVDIVVFDTFLPVDSAEAKILLSDLAESSQATKTPMTEVEIVEGLKKGGSIRFKEVEIK